MIKQAFVSRENYICQINFNSYLTFLNIKYIITVIGKVTTPPRFNIYRL